MSDAERRRGVRDPEGTFPAETLYSIAEAALKGLSLPGIGVAGRHYNHVERELRGTSDDPLTDDEQVGVLAQILLRRIAARPDRVLVAWREPGDIGGSIHLVHDDLERELVDTRELLRRSQEMNARLRDAIRSAARVAG